MSRSQYPTTDSILKSAAKHGIDVRIEFVDGRIASVATIGKAGGGGFSIIPQDAPPEGDTDADEWKVE
jgi:hypothetical protein